MVKSSVAPILMALVGAILFGAPAQAQQSPRVLVIFDTSGSMLWDYESSGPCFGDDSEDYPDMCSPGLQSKMGVAKNALAQIVGDSPDVEFGLMRYGQLEPGDPGFGDRLNAVGAQYLNANGNAALINYDGSTNGCGPADLLVAPGANSRDDVLQWLDGREDYPNDKELRSNGFTPLTFSMQSAYDEVVRQISNDPQAACLPYFVLLLTDGYQQCPGRDAADPAYRAEVSQELNRITQDLRNLRIQGLNHDVRTFVVGFGEGTAFATELDQMARLGGTAINAAGDIDLINGNAYQADGRVALVAALQDAVDNAQPQEVCDGVDNDCDGNIDEDFPLLGRPCSEGVGACGRDGTIICSGDGLGTICSVMPGDLRQEECDGIDNDCDNQIDEGVLNRCGACGDIDIEACDGIDNDCDGNIDEGALNACGECGNVPDEVCNRRDEDCDGRIDEGALNACGECGLLPQDICDCEDNDCDNLVDEDGNNCPRCDCEPTPETCNGLDDDCDNLIDEGVLNACGNCETIPAEICNGLDEDCDNNIDESVAEHGQACGESVGACTAGVLLCENGALDCSGATGPETELCGDNIDNDCDGQVDESGFNECGRCGPTRLEACDNIDNNCDGTADEGTLCPGEAQCTNGECADPCEFGECFGARVCVDNLCVTPCANADCPSGWVCVGGDCQDPCLGLDCPTGTYCSLGECVNDDCYGPGGCPGGQYCQGGRCFDDPCADANCAPAQGCIDGRCFDDCSTVSCPETALCVNGECLADPCARVTCPYPLVCADGQCLDDSCFEVDCPAGRVCENGVCSDDPCQGVICPPGGECHLGRCSSNGSGNGGDPRIDGGISGFDIGSGDGGNGGDGTPAEDGCNCNTHSESPAAPLWGLLILLGLTQIRRTRLRR